MHPFFDLEDDEDVPEISSIKLDDEDLEDERHSVLKQAVSSQELR